MQQNKNKESNLLRIELKWPDTAPYENRCQNRLKDTQLKFLWQTEKMYEECIKHL